MNNHLYFISAYCTACHRLRFFFRQLLNLSDRLTSRPRDLETGHIGKSRTPMVPTNWRDTSPRLWSRVLRAHPPNIAGTATNLPAQSRLRSPHRLQEEFVPLADGRRLPGAWWSQKSTQTADLVHDYSAGGRSRAARLLVFDIGRGGRTGLPCQSGQCIGLAG